MRPWLPERRSAWEAATKAQDPSMNNFLANFEHTLADDEVEAAAAWAVSTTGSWPAPCIPGTAGHRPPLQHGAR